jgi:FkbM family methyltransferase
MLISLDKLIRDYELDIQGVLHLGAHLGEEASDYSTLGCGKVWWVEGNPELMEALNKAVRPFRDQTVLHGLVTDKDGDTMTLHISANDTTPPGSIDHQSSSILELGTHLKTSPDVYYDHDVTMTTTTVDALVEQHGIEANFVNLDLQGAELLALQGATHVLEHQTTAIYSEVNKMEVYKDCAKVGELDRFLDPFGFRRVETSWARDTKEHGWGDALYVKS